MPVKVVKINGNDALSHVDELSRKGFRCVEVRAGEYRCTKRVNEIQDYTVILLSE